MGGMQGPGLESASIDEILQSDVVTVEPDASITEIAETMENEDVGSVIVVEDEEPTGIITDRSVALALRESADLSEWTASDFVSEDLVTAETGMTVFEVLDRMEDEAIRRLPIVGDDGSLEGIVTLDDVFVLLNAEMDEATDIVESQSPRF